mmetsp:Transcript_27834/g.50555  ORF Transcript_27834/g.50555 Transcript_27834/m.50555 type:complete len:110 (+) Transcript_27834:288-617(+)
MPSQFPVDICTPLFPKVANHLPCKLLGCLQDFWGPSLSSEGNRRLCICFSCFMPTRPDMQSAEGLVPKDILCLKAFAVSSGAGMVDRLAADFTLVMVVLTVSSDADKIN